MKYDKEEYLKKIIQLNLNKNKKIIWIGTIICFALVFVINTIIERDFYFNFMVAIIGAVFCYFILKKLICDSAKKINFINDIVCVNQEIFEDKIVEKVIKTNEVENSGEYYYKDMVFVKTDKCNFYLYLNSNAAIIVGKDKLKNVEDFKKILEANNLIK